MNQKGSDMHKGSKDLWLEPSVRGSGNMARDKDDKPGSQVMSDQELLSFWLRRAP